MTHLLIVTTENKRLADFSTAFESEESTIIWAGSAEQALDRVANDKVDLLVADEDLGDMDGLSLVKQIVATNPLIHCALVSSMPPDAYHEASEGLGILMQLPSPPDRGAGERLVAHMDQILHLTSRTNS